MSKRVSSIAVETTQPLDHTESTDRLAERYLEARKFTEYLCEPLAIGDYVIQTMPDVSPTRWHLAHVSW